jgi:hypothetical protein
MSIKTWIKAHPDETAMLAMVTVGVGAIVLITAGVSKHHTKLLAETNQWFKEVADAGDVVYQLIDGNYLTVEKTARQQIHVKNLAKNISSYAKSLQTSEL